MTVVYLLLLIVAAVCFLASAFGGTLHRVNLVALGLFLWVMVPLLVTLRAV